MLKKTNQDKPWSKYHSACIKCKKTDKRHIAYGFCLTCYHQSYRDEICVKKHYLKAICRQFDYDNPQDYESIALCLMDRMAPPIENESKYENMAPYIDSMCHFISQNYKGNEPWSKYAIFKFCFFSNNIWDGKTYEKIMRRVVNNFLL